MIIQVIISALILSVAVKCQNEGFQNFILLAMEEFPEWARSNQLERVNYTFNLNVSNDRMELHGGMQLQEMNFSESFEIKNVYTDLLGRSFIIETHHDRYYQPSGDYNVEGRILNFFPVNGSSVVGFNITQIGFYEVHNFAVTEDGFIDLTPAMKNALYHRSWRLSANFQELNAEVYKEEVIQALTSKLELQFKQAMASYFKNILTQYLVVKVFAKTPLSEIIGTTLRPPTTTATPDTSTETPVPCLLSNEVVMDEEIIEEKLTLINGTNGILTKKVVTVFKNLD